MENSNPTNIQKQLLRIRRIIIWCSSGALVVILGVITLVPVDERILASGVISSEHDTHLFAPTDGILGALKVREGERVTAGQPVILLDDTEWRERLRQVEATIHSARAELAQRKAAMEATAGLPLPKELWHTQEELTLARERIRTEELQTQRTRNLYEKGLVSRQDLERVQLNLETAKTDENKIADNLRVLESGLEEKILGAAAAEIETAYSDLRRLELERDLCLEAVERCVLRAPEDGTVTLVAKRRPGVKVTRGEDLAHIAHGKPVRVEIFCGENQYHRIQPGQRVVMRSKAFDAMRHGYIEGVVEQVGIEPINAENGEPRFRVLGRIEYSPQPLVLGSTVEARIIIRRVPLWRLIIPHQKET